MLENTLENTFCIFPVNIIQLRQNLLSSKFRHYIFCTGCVDCGALDTRSVHEERLV